MTRIVDFIFLIFAAFLGKKALLLSVFAFAPSVLANDIPLATLSVDNIQVRAEWNVVGDSANRFSVEGGTLMLKSEPRGNKIIAIVEVRDKFSTLNPNYEDLAVRITITVAIIGCVTDEWEGRLAKDTDRRERQPSNQIVVESGSIRQHDVIARRYTDNGYNHIALHTVSATLGINGQKTYITTSPSLYEYLKWDHTLVPTGYTSFTINVSENCFTEEIETLQEQNQILQEKIEYLDAHAPSISGVHAGVGRTVTVGTAFVYDGNQHFYLYNVTLANILNEIYTPKVIIDDGKVFSIDKKYQIDNRYEYVASLTVGSDSVQKTYSHEVIVLNQNCSTVYEVTLITYGSSSIFINNADSSKVKAYMLIDEKVYKSSVYPYNGNISRVVIEGYPTPTAGEHQLKSADHFLCEGYL